MSQYTHTHTHTPHPIHRYTHTHIHAYTRSLSHNHAHTPPNHHAHLSRYINIQDETRALFNQIFQCDDTETPGDDTPTGPVIPIVDVPPKSPDPPAPDRASSPSVSIDQTEQIDFLKQRLHDSLLDAARAKTEVERLKITMDKAFDDLEKLRHLYSLSSEPPESIGRKRKHLTTPKPEDMIAITAALLDDKNISLIKYKLMANLFRTLPSHDEVQSYRHTLNQQLQTRLKLNKTKDTPGIWVSPHGVIEMMMKDHPLPSDHVGPYEILLAMDGATLSRTSGHVTHSFSIPYLVQLSYYCHN